MIETLGKLVAMLAIVIFIAFIGAWVVSIALVTLLVLAIAWACNARFSVTEKGVVVGHYKRSTGFVPTKR